MIFDTLIEKGYTVLREFRIPVSRDQHIRPDIIVIHPTRPVAYVLDVRIPYERHKNSLSRMDLQKRKKYRKHHRQISDLIRFHYPYVEQLEYYGLIFGSRGSIHCVTLNLLKATFGFSDLRIGAIIDKAIHESLSIYSLFHSDQVNLQDGHQPIS